MSTEARIPTEAARRIDAVRRNGYDTLDLDGLELTEVPESLRFLTSLSTLMLSRNRLGTLPDWLGELTALRELDLRSNALAALPSWLRELRDLKVLLLNGNLLTELPEWLGELTSLRALAIEANHLTVLPESLANLERITQLTLTGNQLRSLPGSFVRFRKLILLSLGHNSLSALPAGLGQLSDLKTLQLRGNMLESLPESLGRLPNLLDLDLSHNRLTTLPDFLVDLNPDSIDVRGNPLAPEVLAAAEHSRAELFNLLRLLRDEGVWLREAKLVLAGEGEAGKSSLLAAMRGEPWVPNRQTTHGIEIKDVTVPSAGGEVRLNGWDFGGQPDYRPTHQLFFTAPAVYVVVWNPRRGPEVSFVDFWIELIRHRAGAGARIHVVATHAAVGQRGAWIDEAGLRERFGDKIAGFHHVDSETGLGIPELMAAIGVTAAGLPHVDRRYPASWLRVRETIRASGRPYLTYEAYQKLAVAAGMSATSVRSLAISSNALGHWIYYGDEPELANLVIFKPDWLSTAISLVLDDPVTRAANGLLAHRRLVTIWNDPTRPVDQRYPVELHRIFLYLMEKFDISYRIAADPETEEQTTSLVAQLVGSTRPDLSTAWDGYGRTLDGYGPTLEERTYVCEMIDDERNAVTPTGLMYRLIVRFHRFSLGRYEHAQSRHWQTGLVLDNDFNGRALLTLDRKRLTIRVRAAYPENLLHRLSEEIREHNQQFWPGLKTRILVPCGEKCGRNRPGSGFFDVERLTREKARGRSESACEYCPAFHDIDSLLRMGAARPGRDPGELAETVLAALRQNADLIVSAIHGATQEVVAEVNAQGRRNLDSVERLGIDVQRAISQAEEHYRDLMTALEDEARDGPRLFTVDKLRTLNPTHYRLRVTLWCEHSRLPVPELSDGNGAYDLTLPRDWVVKAAPWLKATTIVLRGLIPVVTAGIDLAGVDPQSWQRALSLQLHHAERSLDALGDGIELTTSGSDLAESRLVPIGQAGRVALDSALVRTLRSEIGKQDPGYGGLERVRTRTGYRWVHPRFVSDYRPSLPEIPTGED